MRMTLHELVEQLATMPQNSTTTFHIELSTGDRVPVSLKRIDHSTNPVETTDIILEFNRE